MEDTIDYISQLSIPIIQVEWLFDRAGIIFGSNTLPGLYSRHIANIQLKSVVKSQ